MALWTCRRCTTQFAVGLPYCPHCTGTDIDRGDDGMAKITVHGGASDVLAPGGQAETEAKEEAEVQEVQAAESYDDLTVVKLRAEVTRRNKGRDDEYKIVPASNHKPDLVAALEADDAQGEAEIQAPQE
jgi:Zn-finger nucleic acid-binding protein